MRVYRPRKQLNGSEREAGVSVGAVVVKDGVLIGHGFNQPISSRDPMADVEIKALRAAAQDIGIYRVVDCGCS